MKKVLSWLYGLVVSTQVGALTGLEAYYQADYKQAATILKSKSSLTAQEEEVMGRMYLYGYGVLKSDPLAYQSLQRAADKGSVPAQLLLAKMALFVHNDPQQALAWFRKAAKSDDLGAKLFCAGAYLFGVGTEKNLDLAHDYFLGAAKGHQPIAEQMLAVDYLKSKQSSNRKLGFIWLQKAVAQHDPEAQLVLADLYLKGDMVEKNAAQARKLIEDAVAQDYAPGYAQMAHMLSLEGNPKEADIWDKKAHDDASSQAQYTAPEQQMALWLTRGRASRLEDTDYQLSGISKDWYDKTALQQDRYNQPPQLPVLTKQDIYQPQFDMISPNDIPIQSYYGAMMRGQDVISSGALLFPQYTIVTHAQGRGVDKTASDKLLQVQRDGYDYLSEDHAFTQSMDDAQTFRHLLAQAVLGDSTAQFDVAQMYQQGVGVAQSIESAIKFYHLAAAQNDLPSEYHLGLIYLQGLGVAQDPLLGMDWLLDAAFKGNAYAQYAAARVYEEGYRDNDGRVLIPANKEQSFALYQLSASNAYGLAQYHLADILLREPMSTMSTSAVDEKHQQIKYLLQGAVDAGVDDAKLPLAFYDAGDADEAKQAQAFATIQQAAKAGSIEASFLLGMFYDRGIAIPVDRERALYWYEQSVSNPMSAFILGTYLAQAEGTAKNLEKASDYLQFAASKHFAPAYFNLGMLKKQQGEAFLSYLDHSAGMGFDKAGLVLADYLMSTDASPEQLKAARTLYEQLAKQGLPSAQLKLGYLYEQGLGVAQDEAQALAWYQAAAQQQAGQAQYLLGRLYQFGKIDHRPDYAVAQQWYAQVKSNYAPAAAAAGFIDETVYDDYRRAFSDYQQGADMGDPIAQYNLGLIYEKGKNQAVDLDKARSLYQQAAQQKVIKAMVSLGEIYVREQHINQALIWVNLAAEQHDPDAIYQLGWLSEKGLIPQASINDAIHYYEIAAQQGQGMAILALARLYQSGVGTVSRNEEKSVAYYTQLAEQNYPEAQYQLAKFCLSKLDKGCSQQEAKKWLTKAEQNGHRDAAQLLRLITARSQTNLSYIAPIYS